MRAQINGFENRALKIVLMASWFLFFIADQMTLGRHLPVSVDAKT